MLQVGALTLSNAFEIGPIGTTNFTYIDMKTYGKNSDYDVRIGCYRWNITATNGKGVLNFEC